MEVATNAPFMTYWKEFECENNFKKKQIQFY